MRKALRFVIIALLLIGMSVHAADTVPAAVPAINSLPPDRTPQELLPAGPAAELRLDPNVNPSPPLPSHAAPDLGGLGFGGGMGGFGGAPGYDARGYFSRPVSSQPADLSIVRQNLSAFVPIWQEGGDMLLANVRVRNLNMGTAVILPDTGQRFPENLWDIGFGLAGLRKLENGWTTGAMISVGSASDEPFHGIREMTVSAVGFLKVPAQRDGDYWMFMLAYMPNGQLAFPVPLVRYDWNPSEQLNVGLGLPLSVRWKPTDTWRVDLSYAPLTTVNAKATWSPCERLAMYGGFEWDSEGYFLVDRRDSQDRFFYLEKRLVGGFRIGGLGCGTLDVSGGYAFDRSFGAGQNPLDYKYDIVRVAPGPFLGGKF
jgi:hypothetical protein